MNAGNSSTSDVQNLSMVVPRSFGDVSAVGRGLRLFDSPRNAGRETTNFRQADDRFSTGPGKREIAKISGIDRNSAPVIDSLESGILLLLLKNRSLSNRMRSPQGGKVMSA